MDKNNKIYKILGSAWLLMKPYVGGITGTEDEMQAFLIKQNDLVESFRCSGTAEHKFARDIILACNNYYQHKYMEKKKNGK